MKSTKFVVIVVVIALLMGVVSYMRGRVSRGTALQVYSWSGYLPDSVVDKFTQDTGIPVEISYFSSNEELFAKMVAGATGYDIIMPSDYMLSRMSQRGMLLPLQSSLIPNLRDLFPSFLSLPYDPGLKYSVPFGRGYTGIIINHTKIQVPEGGISWEMVLKSPDPKRTSFLDDMREVFAMGLLWKGLPVNDRDPKLLSEVSSVLAKAKRQIAMFNSEPAALLLKGELNIAHAFSANMAQVANESSDFSFFYPREGAITWTDNFAIPKTARHPDAAHRFINFILEPPNAALCTRSAGLGTASRAAKEFIPEDVRRRNYLYPDEETTKRLYFLDDLNGKALMRMNQLWTELKSS